MGRCSSRGSIGDDFGDNESTFRCQRSHGHKGPHRENFTHALSMPVVEKAFQKWLKIESLFNRSKTKKVDAKKARRELDRLMMKTKQQIHRHFTVTWEDEVVSIKTLEEAMNET
jgi:hypothetical protein